MAFLIYGFLNKQTFPKWMLYLGTVLTFLAMVIAGSRALIAESLQVVACFGFLAYFRPHEFGRITATIFAFSTISLILYSQLDLFKEGLDFLSLRFEEAANAEGTPIEAYFNRYWEILSAPYHYNQVYPLFGNHGLGSATRAGSTLAMKIRGRISCRLERKSLGLDQFWKTGLSWESSSLLGAYGWPLTCSKSALKPSTMEITLPSFYSGPLALFCFSDCWDSQPTLDLPPSVVVCAWLPLVPKRLLDAKDSQGPSADKLSKRRTKKHASLW